MLHRARESFARGSWGEAYALLVAADRQDALDGEDLERLATAATLVGSDSESAEARTRAHHVLLNRGDVEGAARCAFWLAFSLLNRGDRARGGGWLARAHRLLDDEGHDCAERGYLLLPAARGALAAGDDKAAYDAFGRAAEYGERFGDRSLITLGRLGLGQTLTRSGEIGQGVTLLDEAMVAIEAGEVSPVVAGSPATPSP